MKAGNGRVTLWTKHLNKPFLRFVVSGIINTVSTYLIYLFLLLFLNYSIAYTISYLSGIFISYYLNTLFVFNEKVSLMKFLKFPIVYVIQYLINVLMMYVLVEHLGMSAKIVPIIVIIVTIPINYVLSKLIIKGKKSEV